MAKENGESDEISFLRTVNFILKLNNTIKIRKFC